jgi:very-short-patch-repair endonuclease
MENGMNKKLSRGEEFFAMCCRVENLEPVREFRFCERKWRFDFAFPNRRLAVEVEGGIWNAGRHNRASSIEAEMVKYNTAARLGWMVLRYSTEMVESGQAIAEVLEVLKGEKAAA